MKIPPPAPRLHVFLASRAPVGLILRRGPSRHFQLIRWDVSCDRFERGQWMKGRVYEDRSHLSPDGRLFVYFAANWKTRHGTWTAISRPPYFTALALWHKGDTWGGGGHGSSTARRVVISDTDEPDPRNARIPTHIRVHSGLLPLFLVPSLSAAIPRPPATTGWRDPSSPTRSPGRAKTNGGGR